MADSTENLPTTNANRYVEEQRVARLQIRLIEAWECQLGTRRNEQRVEELIVTVERLVAADEFDLDLVGTGDGLLRCHHQMPVGHSRTRLPAVDDDAGNMIGRLREVEHHPMWGFEAEAYGNAPADRVLPVRRDDDAQVVADVLKRGAALRSERLRHTGTDRSRGGSLHRRQQRSKKQSDQRHISK